MRTLLAVLLGIASLLPCQAQISAKYYVGLVPGWSLSAWSANTPGQVIGQCTQGTKPAHSSETLYSVCTASISTATITGASGSPIVLTLSGAIPNGGATTGEVCAVTGVLGDLNANGRVTLTANSSTSYTEQGTTSSGTYTSGGQITCVNNVADMLASIRVADGTPPPALCADCDAGNVGTDGTLAFFVAQSYFLAGSSTDPGIGASYDFYSCVISNCAASLMVMELSSQEAFDGQCVSSAGPAGSAATATATYVSPTSITVAIGNPGSGFSANNPPTVTLSGGGGTGTATPTLTWNSAHTSEYISAITVTAASGYTSAPSVAITNNISGGLAPGLYSYGSGYLDPNPTVGSIGGNGYVAISHNIHSNLVTCPSAPLSAGNITGTFVTEFYQYSLSGTTITATKQGEYAPNTPSTAAAAAHCDTFYKVAAPPVSDGSGHWNYKVFSDVGMTYGTSLTYVGTNAIGYSPTCMQLGYRDDNGSLFQANTGSSTMTQTFPLAGAATYTSGTTNAYCTPSCTIPLTYAEWQWPVNACIDLIYSGANEPAYYKSISGQPNFIGDYVLYDHCLNRVTPITNISIPGSRMNTLTDTGGSSQGGCSRPAVTGNVALGALGKGWFCGNRPGGGTNSLTFVSYDFPGSTADVGSVLSGGTVLK